MEYGDISDRTVGKPVNYLTWKCSESRCAIQVRVEMCNTGKSWICSPNEENKSRCMMGIIHVDVDGISHLLQWCRCLSLEHVQFQNETTVRYDMNMYVHTCSRHGNRMYCLVENFFSPASSYQNNLSDTFIASFSYVSSLEEEKCDATLS